MDSKAQIERYQRLPLWVVLVPVAFQTITGFCPAHALVYPSLQCLDTLS